MASWRSEVCKKHSQQLPILLANDAPMLATILGVLKSGAPYVPFDPAFPTDRLAYYWQDAGATLLITDAEHYGMAVALIGNAALPLVQKDGSKG